MSKPIRILVLEDRVTDAELMIRELRRAGFDPQWQRVQTETEFLAHLDPAPDLILSDYSMPQFDGIRAVTLLRERGLDIPFILISGTIGEDAAVEAMKHGATDYLLKDRIARLGPAVERALQEQRLKAERRRAEEQIHLQSSALNAAANAITITDAKGIILWINPAFTRLTGYSPQEAIGKSPRLLKSDRHDQAFYRSLWQTIRSGQTWRGEFINRRKDGSLYDGEQTITPVSADAGKITHFIGIMNDVTEHKRAEEELRFRNVLLSTQQEVSIDGILVVNEDARIVSYNPRFVELWRLPPELLEPGDDETLLRYVTGKVADPPSFLRRVQYLYEHRREISREEVVLQDGRVFDRYSAPMFGTDHRYYGRVWYFRDITERKQLEEQLRQSQKMEAIGQLAGGVAHDFNNILGAMMLQTELTGMIEGLPEEVRKGLEEIRGGAERAANLTRQLLLFSRRQVMQPRQLDLNESVTSLARLLQRILGEDIRLQLNLHPRPVVTYADAGMLDQVLMNLAVNARDAMPGGGQLTLETAEKILDEAQAQMIAGSLPGRFVRLKVSDTGCGIPPENLSRNFEPFFTTKEIGKGTGLGLATVFGIVKQHGGWLQVHSVVGKGAVFEVFLPASDATAAAAPKPTGKARPPGGSETILLVEDDLALRTLARVVLERHGYRVVDAGDGLEALNVWPACKDRVALLLTDLVMPEGVTGQELAAQLQAEKPDLKTIFCSGYSTEIAGRELKLRPGQSFLQKPFPPNQLLEAVRKLLDA